MTRIGRTRLLILALLQEPGPHTVRSLKERLGFEVGGAVWQHLKALKAAGLVDWEPRHAGTFRATCRLIPVEELQ